MPRPLREKLPVITALKKRIADPNIWRIYATIFALGVAYGTALSVIALHLDERGFDKTAIGSLAAWFAAGIVAFSLPVGAAIRRFSAKRVLVFCLLGYAAAVFAFPLFHSYPGVALARFLDGAFSVGVWVSSETILLSRAPQKQKAFSTSLYAISLAAGYVAGPILARALSIGLPLSASFFVASLLALAAALYVFARLDPTEPKEDVESARGPDAEAESPQQSRGLAQVAWKIKTSCFATFAYGYFQASVVLFLPLFLIADKGLLKEQTILIPAFFAAGMLLFSNVAGRLGDRWGHLLVMRVLSLVGLSMVLGFVFLPSYATMCVAVFIAGATLASISPVSLALQGVICPRSELSQATSVYNAFYAAGMLIGPPISSFIFQVQSGVAMLYHLALLWLAFAGFTLWFRGDDPRARQAALPAAA